MFGTGNKPERSGAGSRGRGGKPASKSSLVKMLPEVWVFVRPQRWLLLFGLVLMTINRVAGLVLPALTKYLVDNIFIRHQVQILRPLVLAILVATAIQGVTSYSLTQLLSKAAQRMIAELRREVQSHIARLPVTFHELEAKPARS